MSYSRGSSRYNVIDDRPMLGPEDDLLDAASEDEEPLQPQHHHHDQQQDDVDSDYEEEVKKLLEDVEKSLPKPNEILKDEPLEDNHYAGPIPQWYQKKLQTKIRETKDRLEEICKIVFYISTVAKNHIMRIEQDHGATFCQMEQPRSPPWNKPWKNCWRFNCSIKCKDIDKPYHEHTIDCERIVLQHVDTNVSVDTENISENEYPGFVMDAVELFQFFAMETIRDALNYKSRRDSDSAYEKSMWTGIKLVVRSNYRNELMLVVRGKKISSLISKLRNFFESGPGKDTKVLSVFCLDQQWTKKKGKIEATKVCGLYKLSDRVGPIYVEYRPKISVDFNSVETIQLSRIIQDYGGLSSETTVLDVGCNFGLLSLMLSKKCERVIGLNTMHAVNSDLNQAEEIKKLNEIDNVLFLGCNPDELVTKCSSLVHQRIAVAVLNLSSAYGKSKHAVLALRDIPSIWRIIVYGSFGKENRQHVITLMSEAEGRGDPYLPMQGCILDKSPSNDNAFDIVILFERKSLIEPKVEVLESGPTLNVKSDLDWYDYGSLEAREVKSEKVRNPKHEHRSRKTSSDSDSDRKFDYHSHRHRSPPPSTSYHKERHRSTHPSSSREKVRAPSKERTNRSRISSPPAREKRIEKMEYPESRSAHSSTRRDKLPEKPIDKLSLYSNFSLSPKKEYQPDYLEEKERTPPMNEYRLPSSSGKLLDWSKLRKDNQTEREVISKHPSNEKSLNSRPLISVKKEFQCDFVVPKKERIPVPLVNNEIKTPSPPVKEKSLDCSLPKQAEQYVKENVPQQLSNERSLFTNTFQPIKSEFPFDCPTPARETLSSTPPLPLSSVPHEESFLPPPSSVSHEESSLPPPPSSPPVLESNLLDSSQIKIEKDTDQPPLTTIKSEPIEFNVGQDEGEVNKEGDKIPTVPIKSEPVDPSYTANSSDSNSENIPLPMIVKSEPLDSFSENRNPAEPAKEIEIIGEKKSEKPKPRIRVKTVDEIIKVKTEMKEDEDLRKLCEERKKILQQLNEEKEGKNNSSGRSSKSDLPRSYKRRSSPSPSRSSRYKSPSSKYRRRSPPQKYRKSPSPKRRRRRSPESPMKIKREPYSPDRFKKEPLSPVRTKRREKSKGSPPYKSFKRDIYGRDYDKSPVRLSDEKRKRKSRSRSPKRS